jgi:hypothetical protein
VVVLCCCVSQCSPNKPGLRDITPLLGFLSQPDQKRHEVERGCLEEKRGIVGLDVTAVTERRAFIEKGMRKPIVL